VRQHWLFVEADNDRIRVGVEPLHHEHYMRRAIEVAQRNPNAPFGAILVDRETGEILAEGVNDACSNPILHGETAAILACVESQPGADWSRLALYTTAEPCPMCSSAILWSGIPHLIFGTSADTLRELGRPHIRIRAEVVAQRSTLGDLVITGGVLEKECDALYTGISHHHHD
jgi:tRNA(adenine34) deaminase